MKIRTVCQYLGEKTSLPEKYPRTTQFVTGISGAVRAQFFKPCKFTEHHQFKCNMRKYLNDIVTPFRRSQCPITKNIADMIYGNNIYQDLLGHEIKKESLKGFFKQLQHIESFKNRTFQNETHRAEELSKAIFKTHEYLAEAFKKDGQIAGTYLHTIGKYQESTKHYLAEILKLPSIADNNVEDVILPEIEESKKMGLD